MKKYILLLLAVASLTVNVRAIEYTEQNLLTGWNLWVTNGLVAIPGQTNLVYTDIHGAIVYSLNSSMGQTNSIAADAFDVASLVSDKNGVPVANSAIHLYVNNTNWIPIAITNYAGQYYVTSSWPLLPSKWPIYMFPATSNTYPAAVPGATANTVLITFQRGFIYSLGTRSQTVWDTSTNVFSFTASVPSGAPYALTTNLPASFIQGASKLRVAGITATTNLLVNQISVGAYVP